MSQAISGVGTQVLLGPSVDDTGPFVLIGEGATLTPSGREWDTNDVTSFTSPTRAKEKIKGLLNPGEFLLIGNRVFDDASQAALKVAFDDPRPYWFQVIFPVNPYTGGGEVWTFAALVLSIDPPKIAPNKALQFFCKLQATGHRQTSNGYVNATGRVTKFRSAPLGGLGSAVNWSGFALSFFDAIPSDAVIQGIYPVIIASAIEDICLQHLTFGDPDAMIGTPPLGGVFTSPFDTGDDMQLTFPSTQFWGPSIGTSLDLLSTQQVQMLIVSSILESPIADSMDATGVGYAIYYTSAEPLIDDAQMPPPFAVPTGQGMAWALPFDVAAATTGDGVAGTAVGTAAVLNSI